MAEDRKDGWDAQNGPPLHGRFRDSGRGATTHGGPLESAEGDYGGGRGTDYQEPPPGEGDAETAAREGEPRPEFPPEGWGERGENYPPAQGPDYSE